jgi:hypothetical protein
MAKIGGIDSMKKLWKTALKPIQSSLPTNPEIALEPSKQKPTPWNPHPWNPHVKR